METGIKGIMFYLCRRKLTGTPSTLCIKSNQSKSICENTNEQNVTSLKKCLVLDNQFTEEPFTKLLIHQKFVSNNQLLRIRAAYYAFKSVCVLGPLSKEQD